MFGTCIAYSEGTDLPDIGIGAKVQFPPVSHLLVAKPLLLDLFDENFGAAGENPITGKEILGKRSRVRLLEDGGEHPESK